MKLSSVWWRRDTSESEIWKQQEAAGVRLEGVTGLMDWTTLAIPVKLPSKRSCSCVFIRKYFDSKGKVIAV